MAEPLSMVNMTPLVTVAMPIHNAGKYLRLAVISIIRQTYTNWELLIIDDGSTDNALQDIANINDSRIKIFRDGVNRGLAVRLNEAIDIAQGRYFARMDGDDMSYPDRFTRQIAALQNTPQLDLIATRTITIDEHNQAIGLFPYAVSHQEICARPWLGFHFPHPTWMGRIEWFRKNRYTVPGPFCCEDQELLLRSYSHSQFDTLNELLFAYRVRSNIDLLKLVRTRYTVFIVQLRHFASVNHWHFALMATAAFFGKICSDISKKIWGSIVKLENDGIDDTVKFEWHKVCASLTTNPKVS
jgi:glycosyltransferase involved in cell wall biosynthesis